MRGNVRSQAQSLPATIESKMINATLFAADPRAGVSLMRAVRIFWCVPVLVAICYSAQAESGKTKPKGKPTPRLSAEQLEAKAQKCLTAKEAFDLYNSEMPKMTDSERDKAQYRRRFWAAQADIGTRRVGKKWLTSAEIKALEAEAAPLAAEAAHTYQTSVPDAVALAERALEAYPEHLPSLYVMGSIYGHTQNYKTAEKWFEKCVEIEPNHFASVYNLAVCEVANEDYESALSHFQACAQINREDPALAAAIPKFTRDVEAAFPESKRTRKQKQLLEETEKLSASIPQPSTAPLEGSLPLIPIAKGVTLPEAPASGRKPGK